MKIALLAVCASLLPWVESGHAQEAAAPVGTPGSPAETSSLPGGPAPTASAGAPVLPSPAQAAANAPGKANFWKRMFTLEAFTATVPGAVVEQIHDWPNEWPENRFGLGKRVASLYGQFVVGAAIEDGVRSLDKEDTRYRRSGRGNFFVRTGHVVKETLVARQPGGRQTFAFSVAANAYGSWAIATLWSPAELRTPRSIFGCGSANMGSFAIGNFVREFWPDVKLVFHRTLRSKSPITSAP